MESLPEDVIVHIFSFLPPEDLLGSVRAACHAWRRLALQRDAWKHTSLSWRYHSEKLIEMVMRRAPCIRMLDVHCYDPDSDVQKAFNTTECQIERLDMDLSVTPHGLIVLKKQVPHLKYLKLWLQTEKLEGILDFLQDMALVELDISFVHFRSSPMRDGILFVRPFCNNRLRRLSIEGCTGLDPLMESLVTMNAASLQELALLDEISTIPLTMKAVRALNCQLKLAMPASSLGDITGMENVSDLTVRVFGWDYREAEIPGLETLSRGLIGASSITFDVPYSYGRQSASESLYNCLREMGTLGRCGHVESVAINLPPLDYNETNKLATILSGLPHLRELHLKGLHLKAHTVYAFEGLKSLQLLDLGGNTCAGKRHPECCVPALCRLIAKVPGLHITGLRLCRRCCLQSLSMLDSERDKLYGLRGNCEPTCATCARYWSSTGGCWITRQVSPAEQLV